MKSYPSLRLGLSTLFMCDFLSEDCGRMWEVSSITMLELSIGPGGLPFDPFAPLSEL